MQLKIEYRIFDILVPRGNKDIFSPLRTTQPTERFTHIE